MAPGTRYTFLSEYQMKRLRFSDVCLTLISIALFCVLPLKVTGQDAAERVRKGIPYYNVYRVVLDKKEVEREGLGSLDIRISDISGKVPSEQIELEILSAGVRRKIAVNENGSFNLPLDLKLKEENPSIVSNLPVGRTRLDIVYAYKLDEANKRFYAPVSGRAGYGDLLRKMKEEYTRLQNILTKTVKDCQTLSNQAVIEERFPSGFTLKIKGATGKYVIVHAKSGDLMFPVTPDGYCPLPIRPDLLEENPPLQIPGENWTWRIDYDHPSFKKSAANPNTV